MKTRLVIATVFLAAISGVPLAEGAKPPKTPKGPGGAGLSLAAKPNPVVHGSVATLSGRLSGGNAGGKSVNLEADPYPFDSFAAAGIATTQSNGNFAFAPRPRVNTRYRVRQGSTLSPVVTVLVRSRTSLRLSDYTPRRGQRVRFAGRACPEHDGSAVAVQRLTRSGWRTVRRTVLRDAATCSTYRASSRVYRDATYRAVVAAHVDHARGISARRRVDVP
jgi:hypothetical protein